MNFPGISKCYNVCLITVVKVMFLKSINHHRPRSTENKLVSIYCILSSIIATLKSLKQYFRSCEPPDSRYILNRFMLVIGFPPPFHALAFPGTMGISISSQNLWRYITWNIGTLICIYICQCVDDWFHFGGESSNSKYQCLWIRR